MILTGMQGLEIDWGEVAQVRVTTSVIVEGGDVAVDVEAGGLTGSPTASICELEAESSEEAFGDGVIYWVADAAHALEASSGVEFLDEVEAGVLATSVGVEDETWRRLPEEPGHPEGSEVHRQRRGAGRRRVRNENGAGLRDSSVAAGVIKTTDD